MDSIDCSAANTREQIVRSYSLWTTRAALGRSPIRSSQRVKNLLSQVDFRCLFADSDISTQASFDEWHHTSVSRMRSSEPALPYGWGAKAINVYLKSYVYVAGYSSARLTPLLHPPFDRFLLSGIRRRFPRDPDLQSLRHLLASIAGIEDQVQYTELLEGFRVLADKLGTDWIIEVDALWEA